MGILTTPLIGSILIDYIILTIPVNAHCCLSPHLTTHSQQMKSTFSCLLGLATKDFISCMACHHYPLHNEQNHQRQDAPVATTAADTLPAPAHPRHASLPCHIRRHAVCQPAVTMCVAGMAWRGVRSKINEFSIEKSRQQQLKGK